MYGSWWNWDVSWIAAIDLGAQQLHKPTVRRWSKPVFDSFIAGTWLFYWTDKSIYWIAKPSLHRDAQRQLHNDCGPALISDLENLYFLHGVLVPQWLVDTPAEELDPLLFAKQQNVEVRREFVRKIGVERLCAKLGTKVLDKRGDYELHLVDLKGETGAWPYLKMRNPSIGVYHMEAVPKECDTVEKALNFRNGGEIEHIAPLT